MKPNARTLRLLAVLVLVPAAAFCAASSLGRSIPLNKLVTPNHDGKNDYFVFRCYNPRDAAIEARIYDMAGREVAKMDLMAGDHSDFYYDYRWDPNSGSKKPGGVYLYQIRVETTVYKGTVAVIR